MYLKNGNVIVSTDINELPLSEIQKGQHLVLLEKEEIGFLNEVTVDKSISMVCSHIQNDVLYVMECNSTHIVDSEDFKDDDEENEINEYEIDEDSPRLEHRHFHRTYLKLNEKLCNIGDRKGWEYGYRIEQLEGYNKQIYDRIFSAKFLWFSELKDEKSCIKVLPIALDDDTYLVFKVRSSFFNHFTKWETACSAFILQKDLNIEIDLQVDFLNFYKEVKEMKKDYFNKSDFEKFDEILKLINHDIHKHVKLSELEQDTMLDKLIDIASYTVSKQQLKELFSFFYYNDDLNIKICVESVKKYHPKYIAYKDGEQLSSYKMDEKTKIEILKADAIYMWDNGSKTGIDPRSGKYHEKGVQVAQPLGLYEDAGGIMYPISSYETRYYINYNDIFVTVDKHHPEVKELLERKRIVEKLTEGA